jgi:hypothetical protein
MNYKGKLDSRYFYGKQRGIHPVSFHTPGSTATLQIKKTLNINTVLTDNERHSNESEVSFQKCASIRIFMITMKGTLHLKK